MQQSFDLYGSPERPAMTLCDPNGTERYSLDLAYDSKIILRFNAMHELFLKYPESIDGGLSQLEAYYFLNNKRLISVDGYGVFQITNVEEKLDGTTPIKEVSCYSLENFLISKRVVAFDGTRALYNSISPEGTILKEMCDLTGGLWTVGTVDGSLMSLQRTFEATDTNIYEFLMGDVAKAFECVFIFDSVNRTISAKTTSSAITETDIFLSFENVIKEATFSEKSDELVTCLAVAGGGDLSIYMVNPLGTSRMYNFDYYANPNWMSTDLITAINAWKVVFAANQSVYASFLLSLQTLNGELLTLQSEYDLLNAEYLALIGVQKVRIQQGLTYADINAQIAAKKVEQGLKEAEIVSKQSAIAATAAELAIINTAVSFETNFTAPQLLELQNFIFENSYLNDNIIKTDLMTLVEIQQQQQQLYNQALNVLGRVSQPRYEFTLESINYTNIPEFKDTFTAQTEPGCQVVAELKSGVFITTVLLELEFSFDDPTKFSMTFSNRLRLDGAGYVYSDLLGQIVKTGSAVAFDSAKWADWTTNYKDSVSTFITSALDASLNTIINSSNQEILIDQNGLRGRTYIPETEDYEPTQVWLTSSVLAFSDDAFETAKLALGQITAPGGGMTFGLVADKITSRFITQRGKINDFNKIC
jgi:hypothetical protein